MSEGTASNQKTQTREREREKAQREQRKADLGAVLSTAEGRRFFWDVLATRCVLFSQAPHQGLERFEGRRDVGIDLMAAAQRQHPQFYLTMVTERFAAEVDNQLHRDSARAETQPKDDE